MKFECFNHQGKGNAYIKALEDAGYERVPSGGDFLLIDIDVSGRRGYIKNYYGKPIFLYPHTARPVLQWDGFYPPDPSVTAVFTIAQGGVDIPRKYGFDKPIHPVGWTYCELKNFAPTIPNKVLFAPIHVNGNGFMTHRERATNSKVFHRLLGCDVELTVRYLHKLEWNGLWEEPGVTYIQGKPDQSTKEIDEADCIISHQNMGYLSVARGKPTLFMAEDNVPISGNTDNNVRMVNNWDLYKDDLMFPLDILDGDTMGLISRACQGEKKVLEWRDKYIGKMFNPELFTSILEGYLA